MIRQSEKAPVIAKHFDIEKGLGPRGLQLKMKGTYVGFSEATIASALQHSTTRQRLSARFSNKAPITPICCRTVMWRVQIVLLAFVTTRRIIMVKISIYSDCAACLL